MERLHCLFWLKAYLKQASLVKLAFNMNRSAVQLRNPFDNWQAKSGAWIDAWQICLKKSIPDFWQIFFGYAYSAVTHRKADIAAVLFKGHINPTAGDIVF